MQDLNNSRDRSCDSIPSIDVKVDEIMQSMSLKKREKKRGKKSYNIIVNNTYENAAI